MARARITIKQVESLGSGKTVWDDAVQGFGVRRQSGGAVSYILKYRIAGRQRMLTIGTFAQLKPEQAREAAAVMRGQIAKGIDPADAKAAVRAERTQQRARTTTTLEKVSRSYIERVAKPNLRASREVERIFEKYVIPAWSGRPIAEVTRRDVTELLDRIEDRSGKVMADRVLAQVRRLFNWWAARDDQFRSPIVRGMGRVRPRDIARDRVLSDDEIRALWKATEPQQSEGPAEGQSTSRASAASVFCPLVRFLVLTAQRRDEAAQAKWNEIVDDNAWTIPAERYKTKTANTVPLPKAAKDVLNALARRGDYIFSVTGRKPFNGFSKAKHALDVAMLNVLREAAAKRGGDAGKTALAPWRLHDLRRTARTLMSRAGVPAEIAERVLGHVVQGVEAIYNRHSYQDEKRDALERLGGLIAQIVTPAQGQIVRLPLWASRA